MGTTDHPAHRTIPNNHLLQPLLHMYAYMHICKNRLMRILYSFTSVWWANRLKSFQRNTPKWLYAFREHFLLLLFIVCFTVFIAVVKWFYTSLRSPRRHFFCLVARMRRKLGLTTDDFIFFSVYIVLHNVCLFAYVWIGDRWLLYYRPSTSFSPRSRMLAVREVSIVDEFSLALDELCGALFSQLRNAMHTCKDKWNHARYTRTQWSSID